VIQTNFSGVYLHHNVWISDTTYIDNEIHNIKINNTNGNLYYESLTGNIHSLLSHFMYYVYYDEYRDFFSILHPFEVSNHISRYYGEIWSHWAYELTFNIGFTYLNYGYSGMVTGHCILNLVTYNIP
jgi:hypothetical protein